MLYNHSIGQTNTPTHAIKLRDTVRNPSNNTLSFAQQLEQNIPITKTLPTKDNIKNIVAQSELAFMGQLNASPEEQIASFLRAGSSPLNALNNKSDNDLPFYERMVMLDRFISPPVAAKSISQKIPLAELMDPLNEAVSAITNDKGIQTPLLGKEQTGKDALNATLSQAINPAQAQLNQLLGNQQVATITQSANNAQKVSINLPKIDFLEYANLSKKFESGTKGVHAIGYDKVGGTSYGTYQIASRPGTMESFIDFLKTEKPAWADRLENAGAANTGSKEGKMPEAWASLVNEDPKALRELEASFIKKTHFDPAAKNILKETGIDLDQQSLTLKEVLWSTSVQHGATGASKIFSAAIDKFQPTEHGDFESFLIQDIYGQRKNQFGSSERNVQASVKNRFNQEESIALSQLANTASLTA